MCACNTHIKWEALLKRADQLGCKYIATGHYAQVREENARYVVSKGIDEWKDQSYVLWGLSQDCLSRTIFPMGKYHKEDIKQMAIDRGYEELAKKPESYEICFIPDNDYRGFLKRRVDGLEEQVKGGNFLNMQGEIIGIHDGYPFYTIGQRKLGISFGDDASYVVEIKPESNEVVIGSKEDLKKLEMYVKGLNYVKYDSLPDNLNVLTKVRYKHNGEFSTITNVEDEIKVLFHNKVEGIAPGQSAVFFEGNDLLGGGFIVKK